VLRLPHVPQASRLWHAESDIACTGSTPLVRIPTDVRWPRATPKPATASPHTPLTRSTLVLHFLYRTHAPPPGSRRRWGHLPAGTQLPPATDHAASPPQPLFASNRATLLRRTHSRPPPHELHYLYLDPARAAQQTRPCRRPAFTDTAPPKNSRLPHHRRNGAPDARPRHTVAEPHLRVPILVLHYLYRLRARIAQRTAARLSGLQPVRRQLRRGVPVGTDRRAAVAKVNRTALSQTSGA
jgi:hypothetical protein